MKYLPLLSAALLCFVAGCSDNSKVSSDQALGADRAALAEAAMKRAAQADAAIAEAERLRSEVGRLNDQVSNLTARLRGEATPTNLARLDLAAVRASSVSGSRSLDDAYYGVLNAFDAGSNRVDDESYTDWVSSGENDPWIEVLFDHNVSVVSVSAGEVPIDWIEITRANHGDQTQRSADGKMSLPEPVHGVRRVRVHFRGGDVVHVPELMVLGYVPPGTDGTVAQPRVAWDAPSARVAAMEAYREWGHGPSKNATAHVEPHGEGYRVTVRYNNTDMCRVSFDARTGGREFTPLAIMQPVATVVTDD